MNNQSRQRADGRSDMLKSSKILVIGRAGMDFYADPPGTRLEDGAKFVSALGGSSANIAAGFCRQGGQAAIVTAVSDDPVGEYCLNQLCHYGVETTYVRKTGGEARNSLAVVDTNGDATQSVIYRNNAADFQMTADFFDAVDFSEFGGVVTTGTVLAAEPSRSATFSAFEKARAAGTPIVFDLDYRPYSWPDAETSARVYAQMADACDVIIGNDVEFGVLAANYDDGLAAARALAARGKMVVYKMGHLGSISFANGEETRVGVFEVDALKPTGAGDAFMAGFLKALADGREVADAIRRGSATAAIVVTRVGCAPAAPTVEELENFLQTHPAPASPLE